MSAPTNNNTIYRRSHALKSTSLWYAALSDLFPTAAGFTVDLEAGIMSPMRESYNRITVTFRKPAHEAATEAEAEAKNVAGRDGSGSGSGSETLIIFTLISGALRRPRAHPGHHVLILRDFLAAVHHHGHDHYYRHHHHPPQLLSSSAGPIVGAVMLPRLPVTIQFYRWDWGHGGWVLPVGQAFDELVDRRGILGVLVGMKGLVLSSGGFGLGRGVNWVDDEEEVVEDFLVVRV
ncbi:uncharacterized protein BO72DRAFT_450909 [Aspergillus fijiensis CBS 313.89]|uniref:Uncharacterized protein n=1 Tax=Aspergillus fijiensis CBS 313.89 TaxID=1448319 RepID=A0A8G1RHU7_9EURO|nr:uncharacterized protein BO72DRAFT_450909 [Aspergillus fijiensis CBS 313.89]RAK74197.1 hypothetical protein BO72DRAFT_450909 [Aspergillus fijiensis CBS 313.89]